MANHTGPDRRADDRRATADRREDGRATPDEATTPVDERTREQFKGIIRWALTLSSLAMITFAAMTYFGALPFPRWIAFLFVAVAAIDVCIAYVVFGKVLK